MGYKRAGEMVFFGNATATNPADGTGYCFGNLFTKTLTGAGSSARQILIPHDGVITTVKVVSSAGEAGTGESWTFNIDDNGSITPIATVTSGAATRIWYNENLNLSVKKGSLITFHTTTPTWVTNPESVVFHGMFILRY